MPTRDHAPAGAPCWLDLGTSDKAASKRFYGELFGWTAEDNEEFGGYTNFASAGITVAGGMQNDGTMGPDGWTIYFGTDDIAALAEAAPANGGKVEAPPMPVGDLGQMAFVSDPAGAFVGAWQPGQHTGFGVHGEDGTPGWFELHTNDWQGALDFYRNVVGCTLEIVGDTPEFRYAQVMLDGQGVAGIMDASAWLGDLPPHWSVYFAVADCDDAIAKAVELGGTVVDGPEDTPYGRLATLTDVTGARFKLVQDLATEA